MLGQIVIPLVCYCYGFKLCAQNMWMAHVVTEQRSRLIRTEYDFSLLQLYKVKGIVKASKCTYVISVPKWTRWNPYMTEFMFQTCRLIMTFA
jgi:hypothetical protein